MITDSFEIFTPTRKFYLTNNKVIYGVFIIGFSVMLFEKYVFGRQSISQFTLVLLFIAFGAILTGQFLTFYSLLKYRPLRGVLDGKIIFKNDRIFIDEDEFLVNSLQKISFPKHRDYVGRDEGFKRGDFNWKLSQGVDNCIVLHFEGRKIMKFYFLQTFEYHLRDIQKQFFSYYREGKMEMTEIIDVLGIDQYTFDELKSLHSEDKG